jgi:hypothetical protein
MRLLLFLWLSLLTSCRAEPESSTDHRRQEFARGSSASRGSEPSFRAVRFTDVTAEAGIDFTHVTGAFGEKWMPETMGSGGAFLDYDGDGWPDILLVNGTAWTGRSARRPSYPALYRNLGDGRFMDVTEQAGLDFEIYGMGVTAADYDGDGDLDLYLTAVGSNRLLRNDRGRFTNVTAETGTDANRVGSDSPAWSTAAAWVDVDRSGTLDLFVCNYVQWSPDTDIFTTRDGTTKSYATPELYDGESCRLYRNEGSAGFRDVTAEAGLLNMGGKSLGIAVDDFNGDGWPDIVVANDTYQNFLYQNDGTGTFTDAAVRSGVAFDEAGRARAGMGIDVADVTGHGRLSIVIGNFSNEPLTLFTQMGAGVFQDLAGAARLTRGSLLPLTFGVKFVDVDLDGFQDLIAANGHIEPEINAVQADVDFEQRPQLFWNNSRGQFVDVSDSAGDPFLQPTVGRGLAAADYDRDGDLDVLLTVNGGRAKLLRNDLPRLSAHWVRIRLLGTPPNTSALGAVVTVHSAGSSQRRFLGTGASYLSQSELNPMVFGIGSATEVDSVTVRWPTTGVTRTVGPLEANTEHLIREGGS